MYKSTPSGTGPFVFWSSLLLFVLSGAAAQSTAVGSLIVQQGKAIQLNAGLLSRVISMANGSVSTTTLTVSGTNILAGPGNEFSVTITKAQPNQPPRKPTPDTNATIETETTGHFSANVNSLELGGKESGVEWVDPIQLQARTWSALFKDAKTRIETRGQRKRLTIEANAKEDSAIKGLKVSLCYETYDSYPVIRKWVEIDNHGKLWLKLERMVIEDLQLAPAYCDQMPLTPNERGAGSSVIAFGKPTEGVIAVNEIPSALRNIAPGGAMGYANEYFEWVLGPGESFVSEPVFFFAYEGESIQTPSAVSTALDRAVEGPYIAFLREHIGITADKRDICAPQWCSWSNFGNKINDRIIREQGQIAARCGFAMLLMDQGWQRGLVGTEPDAAKFADFNSTCKYLHSLGLKIGLWVSSYRDLESQDLRRMPESRSVPYIKRDGGFGMSYASNWRKFCAQDLDQVSRKYGISYYKQDFTNIKFGDIAEGHESRTRKESLLRGLRGLLETQDALRKINPDVTPEITHEIYWGTPGVPCDIAALKHVAAYHIPPNDYSGARKKGEPNERRQELINGCFNARQRFFEHRGLPLYGIEYYAAHAYNVNGSLTSDVQDRQVCSWLMGAPSVFAGDLSTLTPEHVAHYAKRFTLIRNLEKEFGIFRNFQFSGVPAPTDEDWHWWGKLNSNGAGIVVVLRGKQGADERSVNIPWVLRDNQYTVTSALHGNAPGVFSGKQLQDGVLKLKLPPFGQEILVLRTR